MKFMLPKVLRLGQCCRIQFLQEKSSRLWTRHLLLGNVGVVAADGLLDLDGLDVEGKAARAATGLVNTSADPDGPRGGGGLLGVVGAGDEAGTVELEVAVLANGPALELAVLGLGLSTSGVAHDSLAHTGAVNVDLLGRVVGLVEEELLLEEVEGGLVLLDVAVTAGLLVLELQGEVLLSSLEVGEVDVAGRAEGETLEDLILGSGLLGGSRDASGDERSEEESLDLHVGGCWWLRWKGFEWLSS
ncbi:hypothetical protein HG530_001074 [Fusarium avenaceum]|nr:hypothetical protein HG530_001074 [Fusarium avenaceum]